MDRYSVCLGIQIALTLFPFHLFLHLLSSSNMAKLATLFKAHKMLAHLSGTLISHRVAEIISSQLSNIRQNVMFVSVLE